MTETTPVVAFTRVAGSGTMENLEQRYNGEAVEVLAAFRVAASDHSNETAQKAARKHLKDEFQNEQPKDGILACDGGHFEAQFASGADVFADAAAQLLRSGLPGLRFRVSVDGKPRTKSQVHLSTELPVLAPCEWTGRGLASDVVTRGNPNDEDYEQHAVSLDVAARDIVGERAATGSSLDLASLFSSETKLKTLERAHELKQLVGNEYLALIHRGRGECLSESQS